MQGDSHGTADRVVAVGGRHGEVGGEPVETVAQGIERTEVDDGRPTGRADERRDPVAYDEVGHQRCIVLLQGRLQLVDVGRLGDLARALGVPPALAHAVAQLLDAAGLGAVPDPAARSGARAAPRGRPPPARPREVAPVRPGRPGRVPARTTRRPAPGRPGPERAPARAAPGCDRARRGCSAGRGCRRRTATRAGRPGRRARGRGRADRLLGPRPGRRAPHARAGVS